MNTYNVDVVIVGSGGAGLSAALEAHEEGANVLVVSKTFPTHSQTCQAQGGINAAINKTKKSIEAHINDTIKGSHELCNIEAIKLMCNHAPQTIEWLDKMGVPFSRNEYNDIAQRKFGAATEIRTCYSSDYTGLKILHTLYDQCIKNNLPFLNEHLLMSIIKKEEKAVGITALNIMNGELIEIYAKTIILATGGYANLYNKYTTNSHSTTGDGIIAAFNAGCELSNMEMIQFHPTAMKGNNILISESARGEGGYLVDENEERFIDELKPRDEVARAIYKKLEQGNQVYLDLRHVDKDKLLSFMPQEYRLAKEFYDIELDKELLPINPAAHYCMGGIKTNVSCETTVENLFAVGECAQNGLHGANRLGGNSLQEIITFGRIAGKNAAKKAKNISSINEKNSNEFKKDLEELRKLFDTVDVKSFYSTKKEIGKNMFKNVGLFREENQMKNMLSYLDGLKINEYGIKDKSNTYNKNLLEYIEFKHLLLLGKIVTQCALKRQESRGAHYRIDFPEEKHEFVKNTIVKNTPEGVIVMFEEIA